MRIISQSGTNDMPYETTILAIANSGTCIMAITPNGQQMLMAQYSTQEKAEKAMKKLHEAYREENLVQIGADATINYYHNMLFQFPPDGEV